VDCGDGLTEERTVTLGEAQYPLFHALLRKKLWVGKHSSAAWKADWLQLRKAGWLGLSDPE
jgi:hypothetical protein